MFGLILTLLIIDALIMSLVVLLQAGQGGGLAALGGGGTETFVGGRQAVTILTKATWWTGGIFLFLSLVLTVMAGRLSTSGSEVQDLIRTAPTTATPTQPLPIEGATEAPVPGTPAPVPGQ